jgi:hypothetical protein
VSALAALVLFAASAQVESISLTTVDARLAVRVAVSGTPGMVAVHREGDVARVSVMDARLGLRFAGGRRFAWTPSDGFDPALLAATPARLDRLEVAASASEVSLLLHVPPDVSVDVRRDAQGLLLVFRAPQAERVARAETPPPPPTPVAAPAPAAEPEPTPAAAVLPPVVAPAIAAPPAEAEPPAPAAASSDTAELARRLFPAAQTPAGEQAPPGGESVAALYPRLFPAGPPEVPREEIAPAAEVAELGQEPGLVLGPFRVRASVDARYVDADTFVESSAVPTEDRYLEVQPRVAAVAPVGAGRFTFDYAPVLRAFATYDDVNSSSHQLAAGLELPVGSRTTVRLRDRFRSGVLDTRVVDPGGEYFFGLGRFRRNDLDAGASVLVGPRLSLELAGALGAVRFQEPSSFFEYDTRLASAGLGFELTPNLKAIASYVYDTVPRPDERPEAESRAHSAQLSVSGEILPLLTGDVVVGYRSQESPNAGPGGTSYSGFTMSAALARELGREASLGLYASRTTPVSAFEENAFYVSTAVQGTLQVPLPARFQLRGGVGYQWNDYRVVASELGRPREDEILGWYVGLRRPIVRSLFLSGAYRSEDRRSNIDEFDTDADGFYLQIEWDIFGAPPR